MLKEGFQARRQKVRGVEPRVARKVSYVALRGLTNVFLRTTNMVLVTDAMSRGAPVIFADFVDYDEIAHHAGPERPEAMRALEGMDAVLGELARAAGRVAIDYDFVVWSDHGQSLGSTFRQVYGATLAERVDELMGDDALHTLESANGDDWGPLNALLASTLSRVTRRASRFEVGPDRGQGRPSVGEHPGVVVVGGGNLGMVWFPVLPFRPTLVELDGRWPGLVPGLALTPGIGAVMVAGEDGSTMVVGRQGVRRLDDGRCDGSDPLTPYGPRAAADLLHLAGLEHCGDLVLLSTVEADGSVHAFEEQVGSHGGIGGRQNNGLLLHPARLPADDNLMTSDSVGGERMFTSPVAIHDQIERWRYAQGTLRNDSLP